MRNPFRSAHSDPLPPAPPGLRSGSLLVRDVMTPHVQTIGRRAKLSEGAAKMKERGIMHLVVVDVAGRVCGVLSDRDVRGAQVDGSASPGASSARVEDLMAHNPVTVRADDHVLEALEKMRTFKIGSLAVVDELGGAVGIVTGYDVVTLTLWLLGA